MNVDVCEFRSLTSAHLHSHLLSYFRFGRRNLFKRTRRNGETFEVRAGSDRRAKTYRGFIHGRWKIQS